MSNLKSRVQKYNDTLKINELTRLRTDYLISFRLEIKAKMLYKWLKKYKKRPFIQSIITQDVVVDSMLALIDNNKSLQADIALLSLGNLLEAIEETTLQIGLNVKYREHEKISREKKGRDVRDAAYKHYNLLLEIHSVLKDIRKDFRIRTAKDKTRREKAALKKLAQLESAKEGEMKQSEAAEQSPQAKSSTRVWTETLEQPSANELLTEKAKEVPVKTISKQKKGISKPKMSRRKIRKLLI